MWQRRIEDVSKTCTNESNSTAQLAGMSFGLAIGGAVFVNTAQANLFAMLPDIPHAQITQLISGTSGALFASLTPERQHAAREVIVGAWQNM
jgi:hypothetical protein